MRPVLDPPERFPIKMNLVSTATRLTRPATT